MASPAENPAPAQMHSFDLTRVSVPSRTIESRSNTHDVLIRTLKIEEAGDFWLKRTHPKIRLKGRWLEHAGFKAGNHVSVNCVAHGVIELRSDAALVAGLRGVP